MNLSPRERLVLRLIACGYTETQMAALLRLSQNTLSMYRRRVFRKLGAVSSPNAVALGLKSNQITFDEVTSFAALSPFPVSGNL